MRAVFCADAQDISRRSRQRGASWSPLNHCLEDISDIAAVCGILPEIAQKTAQAIDRRRIISLNGDIPILHFRPDDKEVVCASDGSGHSQVYTANIAEGSVRRLRESSNSLGRDGYQSEAYINTRFALCETLMLHPAVNSESVWVILRMSIQP